MLISLNCYVSEVRNSHLLLQLELFKGDILSDGFKYPFTDIGASKFDWFFIHAD